MRTRAARPSDHSARVQRADESRERATSHEIRHAALTGSRVTRLKRRTNPQDDCARELWRVACGVWVWGIVCGRAVLTTMVSPVTLADGRTAMRARHSSDAVVGATLRADVDTSVHHHHSIHACAHLRSEEERAPWGRWCRALLPRRQAPEASREDGTESVAMGRALSHTPTVRHRSNVPMPSQAAGCSRSHVAAFSVAAAVQSSIAALATIE